MAEQFFTQKVKTASGYDSYYPRTKAAAITTDENNRFVTDADKTKWNMIPYGKCSTAAATAAKTVSVTGFTRETGAPVAVKFTITNTAANPTLNVNGTGASAIYYKGANIPAGYLQANGVYEFVYNGSQYDLVSDDSKAPANHASTATTYGVASASNYGHAKAGTATPSALGTAAVGTDNGQYARADHVHPQTMAGYNYIINGDFRIWQRGESFSNFDAGIYAADRFYFRSTVYGDPYVVTRGNNSVIVKKVSSTPSAMFITQPIEGASTFSNKKISMQCKVRQVSGNPTTIFQQLRNDKQPISLDVLLPTNKFTLYKGTIEAPSDITSADWLFVWDNPPQGAQIEITDVKLEIGDTATPFVPRLKAEELALCQRYYEKSYDILRIPGDPAAGGNGAVITPYMKHIPTLVLRLSNPYKVIKRVNPTLTVISRDGTVGCVSGAADEQGSTVEDVAITGPTGYASPRQVAFQAAHNNNYYFYVYHWTADAEM